MFASSPLSVRGSGSGASGGSLKRNNSQQQRNSLPRPPASGAGSFTSAHDSNGVQQLFTHLSSSARRNVSSSPTTAADVHCCSSPSSASQHPSKAAAVTVLGFQPSCSAQPLAATFASSSSPPAPAHLPKPSGPVGSRRGLLSRAFEEDPAPPLQRGGAEPQQQQQQQAKAPQQVGFGGGVAAWAFPDVDRTLLRDLQERHVVFHSELVSMAYMLAAKAHAGQRRKDGTSQLSHGVMTALQLAEMGLDAETVAAGLLHEVLRSHPAFRSQMEEFMPTAVIELVDRVTTISEISQLYRHNKDALGEEKMRRLLLAMEDVKAMLIKLACRCHNMKTLGALPPATQRALAEETLDIFAVVANRLGVWSLKAELEDLAFAVLHPEECEALRAQVSERQNAEALEATIHRIKAALDARGVRYEDISGRPKNLYGIWMKMRANPAITSLDQVYDVTALRVVVANKHDCYVALRCIQEVYRTMPGRSKDYIREQKKPNGYQSLHETIYGEGELPVEVQIRTHKMHFIAEFGFAAHWKYKERLSNEDEWLDKEVQYKKWLTTYKLNLNDNKVRAAGAPTRETALDALGMHLLDTSAPPLPASVFASAHTSSSTTSSSSSSQQQQQRQRQPAGQLQASTSAPSAGLAHSRSAASILAGHAAKTQQQHQAGGATKATAVDPFLQHDRFRLQAPQKQRVEFVLQTQDGVELRQLPVGFPAARLAEELRVDRLPGYVVLVNQRLPTPAQELRAGDLVQVVPHTAPHVMAASAPARTPATSLAALAQTAANGFSTASASSSSAAAAALSAVGGGSGSNNALPLPLSLSSRRRSISRPLAGPAVAAAAS